MNFLLVLAALFPSLNGNWQQSCKNGYQAEESIQGELVAFTEKNFSDLACLKPSVQTISRGTLLPGNSIPELPGGFVMDFMFTGVGFEPLDEASAEAYRARALCGIADWRAGEEQDITGKSCDLFDLGSQIHIPATGEKRFGIVKREGDSLFFGQLDGGHDALTPEHRPVAFAPAPFLLLSE